MATKNERFKKRFLSAADLKGKAVRLEIKQEYPEELTDPSGKKKVKSILSFVGTEKELVLNETNWDSIAAITGEYDAENWPGKKIELYPTKTPMGGKNVDCIRIREPAQKTMKLAPPTAPKPQPVQDPAPADDMDDEIPF